MSLQSPSLSTLGPQAVSVLSRHDVPRCLWFSDRHINIIRKWEQNWNLSNVETTVDNLFKSRLGSALKVLLICSQYFRNGNCILFCCYYFQHLCSIFWIHISGELIVLNHYFLSVGPECSVLLLPGIFWEKWRQPLVAEVTDVPTCKRNFYTTIITLWTLYILHFLMVLPLKGGGIYIQSNSLLSTENAELANKNNLYI